MALGCSTSAKASSAGTPVRPNPLQGLPVMSTGLHASHHCLAVFAFDLDDDSFYG